jgi:CHAT domain-containing protein
MQTRSSILSALMALALPLWAGGAAPAAAPQRGAVEGAVRGFYGAYATGDLGAVAAHWAGGAPKLSPRLVRTMRTHCRVLHRLDVRGVVINGNRAEATVEALLSEWSALPDSPVRPDPQHAVLTLRRERGAWKIAGWQMAEEELAVRLSEASPDRRLVLIRGNAALHTFRLVDALCRIAFDLFNRQKPFEAWDVVSLAEELAAELGDPAARSRVLVAESFLWRRHPRNDIEAGRRAAREAVALAEQAGDPNTLATALLWMAKAEDKGHPNESIAAAERVLALADFVDDAAIPSLAASQISRVRLGFPREALRYSLLALSYAEASGDPDAMMQAEAYLGSSFCSRGDYELGRRHIARVVTLAHQRGNAAMEAAALKNLGVAESCTGNPNRALELTLRARRMLGPDADITERISINVTLGDLHVRTGALAEAEADLRRAEELLSCLPTGNMADVYYHATMAGLRLKQHRYAEAERYAAAAVDTTGLGLRAAILQAQGRKGEARAILEEAIAQAERFRDEITHEGERGFVLNDTSFVYRQLAAFLVDGGEELAALEVVERLKARALRDRLSGAAADSAPRGEGGAAVENARVVALNRRLLAVQRDGGDASGVHAELQQARGSLQEALVRDALPPSDIAPLAGESAGFADVPPGTIVIEYCVSATRTMAFVLRHGARVMTRTMAVDQPSLRRQVAELVHRIESRDGDYRPLAHQLYDLLLRPLIGARPEGETLCIIPDDSLWMLPFQALLSRDGRHVIESAPLFYAPSLSMLSAQRRETRPSRTPRLLAMGDPTVASETGKEVHAFYRDADLGALPDARWEVRELQRLYGDRVEVRTGAAATEETLKEEAGRFDVIHFATHGILDKQWPMYSALLLAGSPSDDGLLEAREIASLPLRAGLVVLSACDSARGRVLHGEGVVGLSWAVLATGCPRTIATQWRIGSASAARLMVAFHQRLAKRAAVQNVAQALREAQLEMLRSRLHAHPQEWAGFILVGRDD